MAINNQPTIEPRTVTGIFTRYIAKTLPLAFDESMSYYECLCALLKYLNDTIVPDINNVNDGLGELQTFYNELQSYVNNYFDNLDVQEEINEKLDKMAESGQLTDIIAQYLGLAGMIAYDTVADMKLAENLVNGSKCRTLGFRSVNDNGGAYYKIRTVTNDDVVDEMTIIEVYDDTLVAELIKEDSMNPKQFGAYGDGVHDDTLAIQTACDYNSVISFTDGTYMINAGTHVNLNDGNTLKLNNAVLKAIPNNLTNYSILYIYEVNNVKIYDGTIQGERYDHTGEDGQWGMCISIIDSEDILIENTKLIDAWGDGLYISNGRNVYTNNLLIKNDRRNGISIISATDNLFENTVIEDITGHDPQAGVDFEPNENTEVLKNIKFNNLITKRCVRGFVFSLQNFDTTTENMFVEVNDYKDYGSTDGMRLIKDNSNIGVKGNVIFNNSFFYDNDDNCIQFRNWTYNPDFYTTFNGIYIKRSSTSSNENGKSAIYALGNVETGNIILKNISIYQDGVESNILDFYSAVSANNVQIINPIHKTKSYHVGNVKTLVLTDENNVLSYTSVSGGGTIGSFSCLTRSIRNGTSTTATTVTISGSCPIGYHCKFINISPGNYSVQLPVDTYCKSYSSSSAPLITLAPGAGLEIERIDSTDFIVLEANGTITV